MSIGENLKHLRQEKGISQGELGKAVGVTQSMIAQLERGTKALTVPLGCAIAGTLNCSIEQLINGSEEI